MLLSGSDGAAEASAAPGAAGTDTVRPGRSRASAWVGQPSHIVGGCESAQPPREQFESLSTGDDMHPVPQQDHPQGEAHARGHGEQHEGVLTPR